MSLTILLRTDNTVTVVVRDADNATDLSGAVVSFSLEDSAEAVTDSGACAYVDTTTVDSLTYYRFRGTIADTITLVAGDSYTITISINAGAGLQREINATAVAALG